MSELALTPKADRRRGRPPKTADDRVGLVLHVRVQVGVYDRLCRLALKVDKPLGVTARLMLERDLARMEALLNG